jgi:hypothetical protein
LESERAELAEAKGALVRLRDAATERARSFESRERELQVR